MITGSIVNDIKYHFRYGNMTTKLILINAGVFLFFGSLYLFSFLYQDNTAYNFLLSKLEMPASLNLLLHQPWSPFTYMFLHTGLFHFIFNMLWLFWFGEIFVLHLGSKRVLPLYLLGGIAGALTYLAAYNLIPVFKPQINNSMMLGASASIFAIVFAAAAINPNYEIRLSFLGVFRIKYIALVFLLLDVINIPYGNAGGYIAHIGGALCGYIYIKALQNGYDFKLSASNFLKRKSKVKITYKSEQQKTANNTRSKSEQEQVDEILEKIARSGYDSLTKAEKDFLFHYSKK